MRIHIVLTGPRSSIWPPVSAPVLFLIMGMLPLEGANSAGPVSLTQLLALHSTAVNSVLGRGGPVDFERAATWYGKAAKLGYAQSQHNLGRLYEIGQGVAPNIVRAYFWHALAAKQGHSHAIEHLNILRARMSTRELFEAEQLRRDWETEQQ